MTIRLAICMVAALIGTIARAAPPLAAYGRLPGLEMAAISPSGDAYAVIGTVGEERKAVIVKNGSDPMTVGLGNNKVRAIRWAGDDILLIYTTAYMDLGVDFTASNAELQQVAVVSLTKHSQYFVFRDKVEVANAVFGDYGIVQQDGHWYGYFGGHTLTRGTDPKERFWAQRGPDLYRVDLETGKLSHVADGFTDGMDRDWLIGSDGGIVATSDYHDSDGAWSIKAAQGGRQIATGVSPLGNYGLIGLGRSPGTVVYVRSDAHGMGRWMEAPLTGGGESELLPDDEVVTTYFDRRSRLLSGYRRDADQPQDIFFDTLQDKRMAATRKAFPGLDVEFVDADDAFDKLIVRTDGKGDSGTWWLVDLKTGGASDIGFSYPAVRSDDVGPMAMVAYKAADGTALAGVLTLPPGGAAKGLPLVVLPHGGPHARDYPAFDWWAQAFASRGYAVFQPNFRGSTGYGSALRNAGLRQWGRSMQTDISDGVATLATRGIVDPKRACIVGASYGGYAALAGVTLQHGLYRCAVSVAGVGDLTKLVNAHVEDSGHSSTVLRAWDDDLGTGTDRAAVSPARLAAQADAPILLIHGKDDTVVPFAQSVQMKARLEAAGKPVEMVTLAGEDHWLSRGDTRAAMLAAAVAFVEKYNPANAP